LRIWLHARHAATILKLLHLSLQSLHILARCPQLFGGLLGLALLRLIFPASVIFESFQLCLLTLACVLLPVQLGLQVVGIAYSLFFGSLSPELCPQGFYLAAMLAQCFLLLRKLVLKLPMFFL
jgi:hypothetical protein